MCASCAARHDIGSLLRVHGLHCIVHQVSQAEHGSVLPMHGMHDGVHEDTTILRTAAFTGHLQLP